MTGNQHYRGHIDLVHIGMALPVDLDRDKVLIEQGGDGRVFETLPLHHMAPVTGGVADGEKDGLVLSLGLGKGLVGPGVPVDRVVGMLQQVGGVFQDQAVGIGGRAVLVEMLGAGSVADALVDVE